MVLAHDRSISQHTTDQTKTIDTIDAIPGPKVFVIDIHQWVPRKRASVWELVAKKNAIYY